MNPASRNQSGSRFFALPLEHPGKAFAVFALAIAVAGIATGLLFHVALLSYFDQSLFDYWELQDFLLAPFRWPGAFVIALITVTLGLLFVSFRRRRSGGKGSKPADGRMRSFVTILLMLLAIVAFVFVIYGLAYHEAAKIWFQSHNDIQIELVDDGGLINGQEISAVSNFRFLLAGEAGFSNRGARRFVAIPESQILTITRCANPASSDARPGSPCELPDRFSQARPGKNRSEPRPAETVVPLQEQAPEPYQRNRLIKEPDF